MTKTKEQLKEDSRLVRIEMDRLIREEGLIEKDALAKVLPKDSNRARKLAVWKKKGWWPLPKDDQVSQVSRDAGESHSNIPEGWLLRASQDAGELHTKNKVVKPSGVGCDARDAGATLQGEVESKVSRVTAKGKTASHAAEDDHDAEECDMPEYQRTSHEAGDAQQGRLQETVPTDTLRATHEAHDAGAAQKEEGETEGAVVFQEARDSHAATKGMSVQAVSIEMLDMRIRQIVKEVLSEQQVMHKMHGPQGANVVETMPPAPATVKGRKGEKGRKENRDYERLTFGIDRVLAQRFVAEAKEKNLSAGKLLDAILWNRYGRPVLSYMEPDSPDSEE
jgi:hypothetical protein